MNSSTSIKSNRRMGFEGAAFAKNTREPSQMTAGLLEDNKDNTISPMRILEKRKNLEHLKVNLSLKKLIVPNKFIKFANEEASPHNDMY